MNLSHGERITEVGLRVNIAHGTTLGAANVGIWGTGVHVCRDLQCSRLMKWPQLLDIAERHRAARPFVSSMRTCFKVVPNRARLQTTGVRTGTLRSPRRSVCTTRPICTTRDWTWSSDLFQLAYVDVLCGTAPPSLHMSFVTLGRCGPVAPLTGEASRRRPPLYRTFARTVTSGCRQMLEEQCMTVKG